MCLSPFDIILIECNIFYTVGLNIRNFPQIVLIFNVHKKKEGENLVLTTGYFRI